MGEDNLGPRNPHRQGQLEILRLRLSQEFDSDLWITRSVLAAVHMQHIDPSTPPSTNLPSAAGASSSTPIGPDLTLQEVLLPKAAFLGAVVSSLVQKKPCIADVSRYSRELQDLRQQLKTWEDMLPKAWRYKTLPNPLAAREGSFLNVVIILPGICAAGIWMAYWLARLSVLRHILLLLPFGLAAGIPSPSRLEVRNEMLYLAVCICCSIPYMLGHVTAEGDGNVEGDAPAVGAFFSIRSLHVCAQMSVLSHEQLEWALNRMDYIGHEKGIRQALVLRDEMLRTGNCTSVQG